MATQVDSILDESWKTGDAGMDAWLAKPEQANARATSSRFAREMKALDDLHSSIHGGPQTTDGATPPAPPYGGSIQSAPGQSTFIGQDGELTTGPSPHNGYVVGANGRRSFQIDGRAPLAASEVRSRNDTDQFFASRHGVVTENDAAWAQKFPNSATANRIALPTPPNNPAAPLNAFSTTPGDANRIAQQYGGGSPAFTTFTPGRQSDPSYINGNTVYPPSPSRLGEINGSIAGTPFPALNVDTSIKVSDPRSNSIDWPELPSSRTASYR